MNKPMVLPSRPQTAEALPAAGARTAFVIVVNGRRVAQRGMDEDATRGPADAPARRPPQSDHPPAG